MICRGSLRPQARRVSPSQPNGFSLGPSSHHGPGKEAFAQRRISIPARRALPSQPDVFSLGPSPTVSGHDRYRDSLLWHAFICQGRLDSTIPHPTDTTKPFGARNRAPEGSFSYSMKSLEVYRLQRPAGFHRRLLKACNRHITRSAPSYSEAPPCPWQ